MSTYDTIQTASAWFKHADGKQVTRRSSGGLFKSDIDSMRAGILRQLAEQGAPEGTLEEDDQTFTVGTQFILKPKMDQVETNTLTVKSAFYLFGNVRGDKRGCSVKNGVMSKEAGGYCHEFTIEGAPL